MLSSTKLLSLEENARKMGSGVQHADLIAKWLLHKLWSKNGSPAPLGITFLLRILHASLALSNAEEGTLQIANQVSIGPLRLRFEGSANLQGHRPLLQFSFERVELVLSGRKLIVRDLPQPDIRQRPFFALIAVDKEKGWLAARGRGGGLALWTTG